MIDARNAVLDAELELASTRKERVELYRKRVESLRELEEIASERHKHAIISIEELLLATAARLQAEIDLFREQAHDSKKLESDAQPVDSPGETQRRAPDANEGAQVQQAKAYPVWTGEWELSKKLNELLGFHDEDLRTDEWPSSFRLSLSKSIGCDMDAEFLNHHRRLFFEHTNHQIVGTGKWEIAYNDASGASQDSGYETSCFVTEYDGATFLWVPVPFAILYGGKISFLEGADREHDAIVIDFNSMPKHLAGVVRASDTVAYKRRSEER